MVMDDRIEKILERLDEYYGTDVICYLEHENAWQLLIATMLSAQCTDARVNIVTRELFKKYRALEDFAAAECRELEKDIHSTGFYHNKAKNIIGTARIITEEYGGEVPSDINLLTRLPGVGRKTANVIRGNIYNIDSIVVDTHVGRISRKLGITAETDPVKVEMELYGKLPQNHWTLWNMQLITHGRQICTARKPDCEKCFLRDLCPSAGK